MATHPGAHKKPRTTSREVHDSLALVKVSVDDLEIRKTCESSKAKETAD